MKDTKVPILGINTGQLGFLTSVNKESLIKGLDMFFMKKYTLIKRTLLELKTSPEISDIVFFPYALNEVTINRKNSTSMLSIKTTIDQKLLTTYWSDGLIISTSTGSTGYSLSSGGPIISPEANAFVLNPIAPHNIGMRPLIVPDKSNIGIHVTGRSKKHLISLDNRRFTIQNSSSISISKAPFFIKTIQLEGNDFFMTLRDKLLSSYIGDIVVQATLDNQVTQSTQWADIATLTFAGTETAPYVTAQFHELGAFIGGSNYIGDIGTNKYIHPNSPAFGIIYKWNATDRYSLRAGVSISNIKENEFRNVI